MENIKSTIKSNPVAVLFLGACPALAATTSVTASLGMALAVAVVLLLSTCTVSLMKKAVGEEVKLPLSVVVTAFYASACQMLMAAFLPKVASMVGIYLAVLTISWIMVKTEGESVEKKFGEAMVEALLTACAFAVLVVVMGAVRELFGAGTFMGNKVPFLADHTVGVIAKAPGAFMVYSILLAVASLFKKEAK